MGVLGPTGAYGKATYSLNTCEPNCAQCGRVHYSVITYALNPAPAVRNSGCPPQLQFYTQVLLAFTTTAPHMGQVGPHSQYNGMPVMRFSTDPNQVGAISLVQTDC